MKFHQFQTTHFGETEIPLSPSSSHLNKPYNFIYCKLSRDSQSHIQTQGNLYFPPMNMNFEEEVWTFKGIKEAKVEEEEEEEVVHVS